MTCPTCQKPYYDNGRVLRKTCLCKRDVVRPMRKVYTVKDVIREAVER